MCQKGFLRMLIFEMSYEKSKRYDPVNEYREVSGETGNESRVSE